MANIWKPSGSNDITAPTLGDLTGKKIKVIRYNVNVAGTGYLFSQGGSTGGDRELGLYLYLDQLFAVDGSGSSGTSLGTITSIFGSSSIVADELIWEIDRLTGVYSLVVDSVTLQTGTMVINTSRVDGMLFRLGGRGSSNAVGGTGSTFTLQSGSTIGDAEVYIDDVLVRRYEMPIAGVDVPDTENDEDGTLQNPTLSDWESIPDPVDPSEPTDPTKFSLDDLAAPIYSINSSKVSTHVFTGTYATIVPTAIEYRVMKGEVEVETWGNVDSFGAGIYSFTPSLAPNIGLTIEVRTTVAAVQYLDFSDSFNIGPVIDIIGSSSAERMFTRSSKVVNGPVHVYTDSWVTTLPAVSMTGSSAVEMANRIFDATGWPVGFYASGTSGSKMLDQWLPPSGTDYVANLDRVAAGGAGVTMIYSMMGWNDSFYSARITTAQLLFTVDSLRTDLGDVPYLDGLAQRAMVDDNGTEFNGIWSAGDEARGLRDDYFVNWRIDLALGYDGIHFDDEVAEDAAARAGVIATYMLDGTGYYQGPKISSSTYSGDTVTLSLDTTGTDYTALVPLTNVAGMQVIDANGVRSLIAQDVVSKTGITLRADAILVDPVTVNFAGYDNNVPNLKAFDDYPLCDDDVSMPLQPLTSPIIALSGSSPDTTPDAFDVGADVTGAALSTEFKSSFVLAGVDESVTVNATDDATISLTENGTYGSSIDSAGGTHWIKITSSALNNTAVTGGASCNGVSDSRTITTLEATPEPDPTLTMPYPLGSESGVAGAGTDVPVSICVASTMAQVLTTTVTWGVDGIVPAISSDQLTTGVLYNITINDGINIATYNVTAV